MKLWNKITQKNFDWMEPDGNNLNQIESNIFVAGMEIGSNNNRQRFPLLAVVFHLLHSGQLQLLFLLRSLARYCRSVAIASHDPAVSDAQRQAAGAHLHAAHHHRLHLHCYCLQFLPQVLRPRGRRQRRPQMSRHVDLLRLPHLQGINLSISPSDHDFPLFSLFLSNYWATHKPKMN